MTNKDIQLGGLQMACPHLFPKQDNWCPETETLYPETETLYPETGYFVSVSGYKVSVSGYKLSCFGNKCGQAFIRPYGIATAN